jgi:hypothetical protein
MMRICLINRAESDLNSLRRMFACVFDQTTTIQGPGTQTESSQLDLAEPNTTA